MGISSLGIGSNLDINGLIEKLMQAERQPFVAMNRKQDEFQNKLSAFGVLSTALGGFQTALGTLSDSSKFLAINATAADATLLSASAGKDAVKGSYNVNIVKMAQPQTIMAAGQANATAQIGTGAATTLTFDFGAITGGTLTNGAYTGATFVQDGEQATRTVTIDSTNNSLQGIRDAVNKANIGVTASIVSDGSSSPSRLVFTSTKSGKDSNMRIGVAGDAALSDLLAYSPDGTQKMTQTNAGQNAELTVDGVAISSKTNSVTDAIPGVTLSLTKIGTTSVSVKSDNAGVKTALTAFVKAYNDLNSVIVQQTKAGPKVPAGEAPQGGALLGDATTRNLQTSLRRLFATEVPGLEGELKSLSQLGVAFQKDGSLKLDATKLQKVIDSNPDDVTKLLATSGSTSDSLISFVSSTSNSGVGTKAVSISQLATQGSTKGGAPAGLTITAGVNDEMSVTINGVSSSVKLKAGTYTPDSMAAQLQAAINGSTGLSAAGATVSVKQEAGVLTVTSNKYGSISKVVVSGTAADALLPSAVSTSGVDVAGTIGGAPATGSGQFLTGSSGTGSAGIQIEVKGGSAPAARGTVNISKGLGAQFSALVDSFLGPNGSIASKNKGINSSLTDLQKQAERLETRLVQVEKRYKKEFSALDVMLGEMTNTSNYLAQQLAQLNNL